MAAAMNSVYSKRPSWRADTTHGTAIYADQLTPSQPPQLIGTYGSPMECLGLANTKHPVDAFLIAHNVLQFLFQELLNI